MVTSSAPKVQVPGAHPELAGVLPAGSAARPGPGQGQPKQGRKLTRTGIALVAVVAFQVLLASVFLGEPHRPALHHAPVAVVGTSPQRMRSAVRRWGDPAGPRANRPGGPRGDPRRAGIRGHRGRLPTGRAC